MELGGVQSGREHRLDDLVRGLIAEHADGHDPVGQATDDVAHPAHVDLTRRRGEDEADGVGAEGDRHQRVLLVGDAADLHPHGG